MERKTINVGLIIEGCLRQNRLSQERLYQHFYGYAMSICLRYAKNRQEARVILNMGFLKVFNKLDQYSSDYPFQGWLRRILINTAIDHHRTLKKRLQFVALDHLSTKESSYDEDFSIDPSVDTLAVLQELSPAYRLVFNLYVMEGYKHHEIAEKLGISVNTSKTNLLRAKQKLKQLISSRTAYPKKVKENG